MITVTDNSDKQINAALLSIDADIKQLKTDTDSTVSSLKSSIDETKAGLTSGATYDINISGNAATAATAVYASTAGSTSTASTAGTASRVTNSLTITNNGTTYTYNGSSAVSVPIATSIASALTTNITNTYSNSAVGTTTYNGSADVANNIYLPNQSLNSTDSPTFNTVTASLSGNATTASDLNKSAGSVLYQSADNTTSVLANGTAGQLLSMNSSASAPEWKDPAAVAYIPPVGFIYVQFPSQSTPDTLFSGTTWTDISSSYNGAFFRANGGYSNTFGTVQAESLPNVTGYCNGVLRDDGGDNGSGNGLTWGGVTRYRSWSGTGGTAIFQMNLNLANGNSIYNGSHVTPYNYSVKIWKRTA